MNYIGATHDEQNFLPNIKMENQLLEWFVGLGLNMREQRTRIGNFEYFNFSAFKKMDDRGYLTSHGRSTSRRIAAIKCAAEMIERQFMLEYFPTAPSFVLAETFDLKEKTKVAEVVSLPARELWTSNGWAVHFNQDISKNKAMEEALERHLLLKSFLQGRWQGFNLVNKIVNSEIELYFYSSQFELKEKTAGLVLAKSSLYQGVSFGYCLGSKAGMANMSFWENAIFEAIDKILTLKGKSVDLSLSPTSWIAKDTKDFLEQTFDMNVFGETSVPPIQDIMPKISVKTFDIAAKWSLPCPFFASFAWGENLIPLFNKASLSSTSLIQLKNTLRHHGIENEIPDRHPIL